MSSFRTNTALGRWLWDSEVYSRLDVLKSLLSIALYIWDVASDILLAKQYFDEGKSGYQYWTVAFVANGYFFIYLYNGYVWWRNKERITCRRLLVAALGPVVATLQSIYYGRKGRNGDEELRKKSEERALAASRMLLIESFVESAPQLWLQLHIIFAGEAEDDSVGVWIQRGFSMLSSWLSVAFSALGYYTYRQKVELAKRDTSGRCGNRSYEMKKSAQLFFLLWRLFEIGVRVLSVAIYTASTSLNEMSGLPSLHLFVVMTVYALKECRRAIKKLKNEHIDQNGRLTDICTCICLCPVRGCKGLCFGLAEGFFWGYITLFCYVQRKARTRLPMYIFHYLLMYMETILFLVLVYGPDSNPTYSLTPIVAVIGVCALFHFITMFLFFWFSRSSRELCLEPESLDHCCNVCTGCFEILGCVSPS